MRLLRLVSSPDGKLVGRITGADVHDQFGVELTWVDKMCTESEDSEKWGCVRDKEDAKL